MRRMIEIGMALTVLAATLPAQAEVKGVSKTVKPSPEARAAMQKVNAIRASAKGKKGETRAAILREAVAGYAKMVIDHAGEPLAIAPASFAAAEIWRAGGDLDKAKDYYRKSIQFDSERYEARSTLQLAHIARRNKDAAGAIALYQKVAKLKPKSARSHQARTWIGRCHAAASKPDEAIKAYRTAIDLAASPTQTIDACNRLAGLFVKLNKLDDAEQVIGLAATAAKAPPTATGKMAVRQTQSWEKAFARMSARRALQRARDKATKAHKDAVEIERKR